MSVRLSGLTHVSNADRKHSLSHRYKNPDIVSTPIPTKWSSKMMNNSYLKIDVVAAVMKCLVPCGSCTVLAVNPQHVRQVM